MRSDRINVCNLIPFFLSLIPFFFFSMPINGFRSFCILYGGVGWVIGPS